MKNQENNERTGLVITTFDVEDVVTTSGPLTLPSTETYEGGITG